MTKIKKIFISVLFAGLLFFPRADYAAAVSTAELVSQIELIKRQILILQIELIKTQIADLQKQLNDLNNQSAKAFIDVIYPNGGEKLVNDDGYYIRWESEGVDKVTIELEASGNESVIASKIAAGKGRYYWSPGNISGNSYRIRIFDSARTNISDTSDKKFSIVDESDVEQCSDGTAYYHCSSSRPKYCNDDGDLVQRCDLCGCSAGRVCTGTTTCQIDPYPNCLDGTLNGQCSSTKPLFCSNGTLVNKCSQCGCSNSTCSSNGTCQGLSSCSDGTLDGRCSSNKPLFCLGDIMMNMCWLCGCPSGSVCGEYGICRIAGACSDGTANGQCSSDKPLFCNAGQLINSCGACGCPTGKTCANNGVCQ